MQFKLLLLIVAALALGGCAPTGSMTPAPSPSATPIPLRSTPITTTTPTRTPLFTLEPDEAEKSISTWLREPVDCAAPCFWGITPGRTTLDEAKGFFTHLGLEVKSTTVDNRDYYGISYASDNGPSLIVTLTVLNEIVENVRVKIGPETATQGVAREWLAYSPETLIGRYGPPTKVDFVVDRGAPEISYAMRMYFQAQDLISEYYAYHSGVGLQVCPLTDQFDSVRIWMGKEPVYPPGPGVPLEEAASLTMDEFAQLMTGSPEVACINLKEEAFP